VRSEDVRRIAGAPRLTAPLGPYSQVVVAGRDVYIAGQGPVSTGGETVGRGDFAEQARQVYRNLGAALNAAGCGWTDVLKMTVYLTDMEDLAEASRVRTEVMPDDCLPASTVVEIEAVARLAQAP
jgi:enamine deaminase RidA (YjgF/YER057c/UK114 family)